MQASIKYFHVVQNPSNNDLLRYELISLQKAKKVLDFSFKIELQKYVGAYKELGCWLKFC